MWRSTEPLSHAGLVVRCWGVRFWNIYVSVLGCGNCGAKLELTVVGDNESVRLPQLMILLLFTAGRFHGVMLDISCDAITCYTIIPETVRRVLYYHTCCGTIPVLHRYLSTLKTGMKCMGSYDHPRQVHELLMEPVAHTQYMAMTTGQISQ